MSTLQDLANIYEAAAAEAQAEVKSKSFDTAAVFGCHENAGVKDVPNQLVLGDNLDLLRSLSDSDICGKIDFIYIDPPFFSGADYSSRISLGDGDGVKSKSYADTWDGSLENFLSMLTVRLILMKRLLTERGVIAVHMDRHAVHYVKVLMDEIFGGEHFVNELIWTYKSGGASKKSFAHKHDIILVYSKGNEYTFNPQQEKSYNRGFKPYHFKGVEEFQDKVGWYTMVNRRDVLAVDMVGRTSSERTGYATQKPEALLKILVESFTNPGDLCADFFGGSGTLAASAYALGRCFISCDCGPQAVEKTLKRLALSGAPFVLRIAEDKKLYKGRVTTENTISNCLITSYTRRLSSSMLTDTQQEKLRKVRARDRLALLDFWACGTLDDAGIFHSASVGDSAAPVPLAESPRILLAFDHFGGYATTKLEKF